MDPKFSPKNGVTTLMEWRSWNEYTVKEAMDEIASDRMPTSNSNEN